MDIEIFRDYCLSKEMVTEGFPFDETTLVFKVAGKIFCLLSLDLDRGVNLKFTEENAVAAREKYDGVIPGYHMNKKYWNTVSLDADIPNNIIFGWVDDSYNLVKAKIAGNKKKTQ